MPHLPLWYLGQLSEENCNKALEEFKLIPTQDATMGIDANLKDHNTRNTKIRFANKNHWFGKILFDYAINANKECQWNYDINGSEDIQLAEYGVNQHYEWHTDTFTLSGAPIDRKVTVVCLMNNPSEFEGGQLQFRLYSEYNPVLIKGSIIAFPSIIEHRVLPVLTGIRYTATMWLFGPKFK